MVTVRISTHIMIARSKFLTMKSFSDDLDELICPVRTSLLRRERIKG